MCIPKLDIHLVYLLSQQAQGSKVLYLCSLFIYFFLLLPIFLVQKEDTFISKLHSVGAFDVHN